MLLRGNWGFDSLWERRMKKEKPARLFCNEIEFDSISCYIFLVLCYNSINEYFFKVEENMASYHLNLKEIKRIEKHYDKCFKKYGLQSSGYVLHEIVSGEMHIDIEHYLPSKEFPYHVYATVGMSGYTMPHMPFENIELIMFLPKDWKTDEKSIVKDEWFWPIKMLKIGANLPCLYNTEVTVGHSFSVSEEFEPFDKCTEMCCGFYTFPTWLDHEIFNLKYGFLKRRKINFLCLTAITKDEYTKLNEIGSDRFVEEILLKDDKDDLLVRNKR